jgi:gliding motility-associated-like protein
LKKIILWFGILCSFEMMSQENLVLNGGFEILTGCVDGPGQIELAEPWKLVKNSPDLFHYCVQEGGFRPPVKTACLDVFPQEGDGFIGLAMFGVAQEKMEARMTRTIPEKVSLYCSMHVFPQPNCGSGNTEICYTNGIELSFVTERNTRISALVSDTIISNLESWTHLETCYETQGGEAWVRLGNPKEDTKTLNNCVTDGYKLGYTYVDNIIVSLFDVLPETLYICDDYLDVDVSYYDVPLLWEDGPVGGQRRFEVAGDYVLLGELEKCFLRDPVTIIKIEDEYDVFEKEICPGQELSLNVDLPVFVEWDNGERGNTIMVNQAGSYIARIISDCDETIQEFLVRNTECLVEVMNANIFSPNNDGINDEVEWTFTSFVPFEGTLYLYDRFGNLIFQEYDNDRISWDGKIDDQFLTSQVFTWVYVYRSNQDGQNRSVAGDLTLVK